MKLFRSNRPLGLVQSTVLRVQAWNWRAAQDRFVRVSAKYGGIITCITDQKPKIINLRLISSPLSNHPPSPQKRISCMVTHLYCLDEFAILGFYRAHSRVKGLPRCSGACVECDGIPVKVVRGLLELSCTNVSLAVKATSLAEGDP